MRENNMHSEIFVRVCGFLEVSDDEMPGPKNTLNSINDPAVM